jgi:glycerophosphoryl diester phosphodiesterase
LLVRRIILAVVGVFIAFVLFQWFYDGVPADVPLKDDFEVIAHRGAHVNWEKGTYDLATGCEATHIYRPPHEYIENTVESIGAAFEMGATIVEIDIRRTSDDHLVVFHDWRLDCRTDGSGEVGEQPLEHLQSLDIGYGYTYDDGKTYPFRGRGVGAMPTLVEVLQAFPDKKFLIDHKDGSLETAVLLADIIEALPAEQRQLLYYWGPDETYNYLRSRFPTLVRLLGNRPIAQRCFLPYLLTFGLGGFPEECGGAGLGMPAQYAPFIWGWPYRFLADAAAADIRFYLLIDTEEEARAYAGFPVDGRVTDYIETTGQYFKE